MTNSKFVVLAATVLLSGMAASGQSSDPAARTTLSFTGNQFLEVCSLEINHGKCLMYMSGLVHGLVDASYHHGSPISLCIPDEATNQQVLDVALKYLKDHPESRDGLSAFLVPKAIIETWSCKESSDHASRPAAVAPYRKTATTFRGHTIGENWQNFILTEAGLCKIRMNTESCSQAESGEKVVLVQFGEEDKSGTIPNSVRFVFDQGRLQEVIAGMTGPTFADLSFLEKTYGRPTSKRSNPAKGIASSTWVFSDGGEVDAEEQPVDKGNFNITIVAHRQGYSVLDP
jgi:hypothetical protein